MSYPFMRREPEPDDDVDIDVCQGCGAYFSWQGIMRQRRIAELKLTDGASLQRCFKCLEGF